MSQLDLEEMDRLRADIGLLYMENGQLHWENNNLRESNKELNVKVAGLRTIRDGFVIAHVIIAALAIGFAIWRNL